MSDFDPDWCICPGETLREWREENHLGVKAAATTCGRMPADMYGIGSRWTHNLASFAVLFGVLRVFFDDLPGLWGIAIAVVVVHMLGVAEDRVYHAYWTWRHPARCDGWGHAQPEGGQA